MGKKDMIRLFINALPGNFFTFLLKLSDFFLFRVLCDGFLMAFQAGVNVRYPGEGLGFEKSVACVTPQSLFQMLFMIERDGLIGFKTESEADEEEQQKNPDSQSKEEGFQFLKPSGHCFTPLSFL
jgi:hypothetical protein